MPEASLSAEADFIRYHASTAPRRKAVHAFATGETLAYAELDAKIAQCTGWLERALAPAMGKRVAILARNGIDILLLHFACVRSGAILQPLNWRLTGPELAALVADAEPDIFIYETEFEAQAKAAVAHPSVREVLRIAPGANEFRARVDAAEAWEGRATPPETPITLLYTSGTTGRSKGVIVTRMNAWCCAVNFVCAHEIAPHDVLLCDMPMFHVAGLFAVSRSALFTGATLLISDRFVPAEALARIADPKHGVTHYFAVPQMAAVMLDDPSYRPGMMSRLKALAIGGAPLPLATVERLIAEDVASIEGYGSSEAGTVFGLPIDRERVREKRGSAGVCAMLISARIVDGEGRDLPDGEVGEIWLKGPSVTPGYWNQPDTTARAFSADGWFKTGDAARRDKDGFYFIVDRWKDMYISGGENVYPAEVEAALRTHPAVGDAAVVGVPDAQWGEVGCAFVVLREGASATEAALIAYCRGRLARYKTPKHVRFVPSIARNASGKILKDVLRRQFAEGK